MKLNMILRNVIIVMIVLCNVGCDQISKNIVRGKIDYNEKIEIIDHFTLTQIENAGAFLSLGDSLPAPIS